MRRSRLELYEDIICALANHALTIDAIAFECCTDCTLLQDRLGFLANNGIVTVKESRNNRAFYMLTNRGLSISKTIALTKQLKKLQIRSQSTAHFLQEIPVFASETAENSENI